MNIKYTIYFILLLMIFSTMSCGIITLELIYMPSGYSNNNTCNQNKKEKDIYYPCPNQYYPVCGQNGITYNNPCEAMLDGEFIFREGRCPIWGPS